MIDVVTFWLDWFGVAVFATTGALVASRKQMDLIGFILLGTVTGIGGGTIRDTLLGNLPVFWITDPRYLITCVAVSSAAFFLAHIPQSRYALVLRFDAVGLAIFAVTGAEAALDANTDAAVAVAMGVITATFGGIVRDILGGESPAILRQEIYVTAALVGATLFVALAEAGVERSGSLIAGFAIALIIRLGALRWHWSLPRYRPRPGQPIQ